VLHVLDVQEGRLIESATIPAEEAIAEGTARLADD
jgi:hypothetical protein